MKVLVVAEYYPRAGDPSRGVWAHRQAVAAAQAGAEVRVLVLHRPVPPLASLRRLDTATALAEIRQPPAATLDGIAVEYLRYLSPPRAWSYGSWGAWAAPLLAVRLRRIHRHFPFELVHAHYAIPAGDAVRRARLTTPLVVSVHGHDVFGARSGGDAVATVLRSARLVLANSAGTAARCARAGAHATRVVHLGADLPPAPAPPPERPILVTVAHLAARKRHADVLEALARLTPRHPELRYVIVGAGPEREALKTTIARLGLTGIVELRGALPPAAALAAAQDATLFVMPSVDEAFGVAYVEAMAAGVPAIGCEDEAGPEEIAAATLGRGTAGGGGIALVPPRDAAALAATIDALLSDPAALGRMRTAARATVEQAFTWERCGRATVEAYAEARR